MALPWHIPLEAITKMVNRDKLYSIQPTLTKHFAHVNIHSPACEELQTGLMCEIGTANKDPGTIQRLLAAGLTVAKLNLIDLEPDACNQLIQSIRQAVFAYSSELGYVYPLAVVADVKPPDIVTGGLKGGDITIDFSPKEKIRLTTEVEWKNCGTRDCLYVDFEPLIELKHGDVIYIQSLTTPWVKLNITDIGHESLDCVVVDGGTIGPNMTVKVIQGPKHEIKVLQSEASSPSLACTEDSQVSFDHMEKQVKWAINSDVDALTVPSTHCSDDIRHVKLLLGEKGKQILVMACIETLSGLDNFDEIIDLADGIFLDRAALSLELPVEKIFIATKSVIAKCNLLGKPVVCKVVINEQIPILCITDIANLILDGVDVVSLELHYNSPLTKLTKGRDAVRMAEHCLVATGVVCRQAENIQWIPRAVESMNYTDPTRAICYSAAELAVRAGAVLIICLTNSGRTAKMLANFKPPCPILAVTRICQAARQLRFWRGVRSLHYTEEPINNWLAEVDARIFAAVDYAKLKAILHAGDGYVIVSGTRCGGGYCDSVRLLFASARETVLVE